MNPTEILVQWKGVIWIFWRKLWLLWEK